MKTTHLQYLPCKCSWSHSDQIATSKICCNSDKLHTWFCLDSSTHSESSFPQGFPGDSEFTDYKGNLSCKTGTSGIVNCPSLPVLCINFEGETPSYFQITALWTWTHGHYNIHMAYSILSLQNSLNAIISSKDCTLLLRESYRIVICAQCTLYILLQPYDLLNDLKINNKLIYSALNATCLRIWDIARYKTLKSWPAPRLAQPQKCTKFLGPQVLKTILYKWQSAWKSLDNLFFHIVESTSIIWTWLCKWLRQPDFIPKWELFSCY